MITTMTIESQEYQAKVVMFRKALHTTPREEVRQNPTLIEAICIAFEIPQELLFVKTRIRDIQNAKKCYIYIVCKLLKYGPSKTSRHLNCNHATVINSCKKFICFYETEPKYRVKANYILQLFYAGKLKLPDMMLEAHYQPELIEYIKPAA